jgi:vancomycin resistance protein YoaR
VGVSGAVLLFGYGDRICRGVTVGGVGVDGLTRAEAAKVLDTWWRERREDKITLTALDDRRTIALEQLGATFDSTKTIANAFAVGRTGGIVHRAVVIFGRSSPDKSLDPTIVFSDARLRAAVAGVARSVNRPHKDACLKVVADHFVVEPEQLGVKVDEDRAMRTLRQAVADGKALVPLPVAVDTPNVRTQDAARIDTLLASFTTSFNPGKRDRTHNLKLASNSITGLILKPGQEFSYNKVVGPRLIQRGYRNAPIFVRGNVEPGVGGGCCQVSSTIYNAALLAGMKIVERAHHSRIVPYVKPGRDATVVYGLRDFRFQNSNANPIGIIITVKGSVMTANIYGAAEDKKQVNVFTGGVAYKGAGLKTVIDGSIEPGKHKVVDPGSPGASVSVYRKITNPDGTQTTHLVSKDRYPAQSRVVATGRPQPPAADSPSDEQ